MVSAGTLTASNEYNDLMRRILDDTKDKEPQKGALKCPRASYPSSKKSSFDRFPLLKRLWESISGQQSITLPPLHPTAQLIQNEIRALPPFTNMTQLNTLTIISRGLHTFLAHKYRHGLPHCYRSIEDFRPIYEPRVLHRPYTLPPATSYVASAMTPLTALDQAVS